jgi:protein ImuA
MLTLSSQNETLTALRQKLAQWQGADRPAVPCGLESILPAGLHRGALVEYLADSGSGATVLSLVAAREACREGKTLVVVDRERQFYPPAAANFNIRANTILIHPQTKKDELWALNQSLSCPGVGAVLGWPSKLDDRAFRALQLAAERGGTVGLLIRPTNARGQPSWSDVQLLVEALPEVEILPGGNPRRLRVEVVRCRNGTPGASMEVELDDENGTLQKSRIVHLAAELAAAKTVRRSPGA